CSSNPLLHAFWCTVCQFFSFFQSKTGKIFNCFYHVKFVRSAAFKNYVESCFFFNCCCSATCCGTGYCYCCCCRFNSVFVFKDSCKFVNFFYCKVNQLFCKCF